MNKRDRERAVVRAAMRFHLAYMERTAERILGSATVFNRANELHTACARLASRAARKGRK